MTVEVSPTAEIWCGISPRYVPRFLAMTGIDSFARLNKLTRPTKRKRDGFTALFQRRVPSANYKCIPMTSNTATFLSENSKSQSYLAH